MLIVKDLSVERLEKKIFENISLSLADTKLGFEIPDGCRFDSSNVYSDKSEEIHNEAIKNGYNLRILPLGSTIEDSTGFGISLDELSDEKEVHSILTFIAEAIGKTEELKQISINKTFNQIF